MADLVLTAIGLHPGEHVRFRRAAGKRHEIGRVARVEADGSITFFDADGAARSQRPEALEVRRPGARGRLRWHNVGEVALTWEQLSIF